MEDLVITDGTDIYVYFEVLRQLRPARVLDVGMFLKRIGAVSREAMSCRLPEGLRLDGIDAMPERRIPIYDRIYDHIYEDVDGWIRDAGKAYDAAVLIGHGKWLPRERRERLWEAFSGRVQHVLTDLTDAGWVYGLAAGCANECLRVDDRQYVLFHL